MPALSGRQVKNAFTFVAWRDGHALGRAGARRAGARRVDVARQRVTGHVQITAEEWDRAGERMADLGAIGLTPGAIAKALSAFGELRDYGVNGVDDRVVPCLVFRIEQIRRAFR